MTVSYFMLAKSGDRMKLERNVEREMEIARQFALDRYDVLDTAEETSFDHITQAVKLALDVPMASISLMDGKRLWFKSKIGFDDSEIPRETAFCNYTIDANGPMIIEDTALDPLFKNIPTVVGAPYLRSYIGVPLTTPDGHNIGTLCALDIVPRQFSHSKIELMEQLAELVIHELELRQQTRKDRLTGALTRSGFALEAQKAISLYDRQKIRSTLVLFSVDRRMMAINPSDGPSCDKLLRAMVQSLIKRVRPTDCVGRIGGLQFAILLTGTSRPDAIVATEEFLKSVEGMNHRHIVDIKFSEISPEFGICEDWLKQANADAGRQNGSGRHDVRLESGNHSGIGL